jgi:uncharacterized membrane protein
METSPASTGRIGSLLLLGTLGLAASIGAIYATPIAGVTDLGCPRGMDCAAVLGSAYSKVLGIPLGVAGGFYFAFWMLFLIASHRSGLAAQRWVLTLTLSFGALVSVGLLAVLAFVIRESCLYCLVTHAANLAAVVVFWPLRQWRPSREGWKGIVALGVAALLFGFGLWQLYEIRVARAEAAAREKTIW